MERKCIYFVREMEATFIGSFGGKSKDFIFFFFFT